MTPAEIAQTISPGMVRALRDPMGCGLRDIGALIERQELWHWQPPLLDVRTRKPTEMGRAVLAHVDGEGL